MLSVISAIIFSLTLVWPELSIIGMSSFLVPLFLKEQKIINGAWWATITSTTYWWWLAVLFYNYHVGAFGWIVYILLIIWCILLSSIWFYFLSRYQLTSSLIFFLFIIKYSMIIIGCLEGMPFYNPLVLLSSYQILLMPIYYIGDAGMLFILFGVQLWVAKNVNNKKILSSYFISIITLQAIALYVQEEPQKKDLKDASIIIPWWYKKGDAMFCGYRLSHDICKAVQKKQSKIIITPESTFCHDLTEYKDFISIWCQSAENIPMLLCAHSFKDNSTHNGVFVLHNNEIILSYFKKHAMPLVEKSIWLEKIFDIPILSHELINLNKKNKGESQIRFDHDNDLIKINGQIYQIFVCSEFFFESKEVLGYPILLLWNDTWLSSRYAQRLALLFIHYFEKKYMVNIYHIATSSLTNIKS